MVVFLEVFFWDTHPVCQGGFSLLLSDIFKFHQSSYDLRNEAYSSKKPNTVIGGTETVSYRCSQISNSIPTEAKNAKNPEIF